MNVDTLKSALGTLVLENLDLAGRNQDLQKSLQSLTQEVELLRAKVSKWEGLGPEGAPSPPPPVPLSDG